MEKRVLIDSKGPRRIGKTNWTKLRADMQKAPIIDDEAPELVSRPGVIISKPGKRK